MLLLVHYSLNLNWSLARIVIYSWINPKIWYFSVYINKSAVFGLESIYLNEYIAFLITFIVLCLS